MNPVRAAFAEQARACRALGSELTAQVLGTLGGDLNHDQGAVARRVLDWQGDPSHRGDSVPLRLAGALHGLVLDWLAPDLAAAYAAKDLPDGLLLDVIATHQDRILNWLERTPQTNEVARSAVLISGARFALSQLAVPLPLAMKELGASAGLNLNFPDYGLEIGEDILGTDHVLTLSPDWRGAHPGQIQPKAVSRRGVDLAPPDLGSTTRLRAYIWPDQPERLTRLDAALAHARAHPPEVETGDAADWLAVEDLSGSGCLTLVYHTIALQYFPRAAQRRIRDRLTSAGATANADHPLAHLAMEADDTAGSAAMTLTLWDGGMHCWSLGRADFHGRWIDWSPQRIASRQFYR